MKRNREPDEKPRQVPAGSAPGGEGAGRRKRIVIVDDSPAFCDLWENTLCERYGDIAEVETYRHPYDALPAIDESIDLLIVDLEMPGMDGQKFVAYARQRNVPPRRIIVTSSHHADELHRRFRIGEAIAVINKTEPKQQEAFMMILDSVMRK
ncbi:MAG: response regulator [Acidobacteria bacterium]|nr:response regulator [Acidobacteriota bacterium]